MKKTVLITGGCGFIGSNFVRYFHEKNKDWSIVNLDKLTYAGNPENLKSLESSDRYRFVRGDISDTKLVKDLMEKVEAVVHFAAETHVDRSIESAGDFIATNITGTTNLLNAARLCQISRFIHISTDEVYGSLKTGSAAEEDSLRPNSPYASSKAAADLMVRAYRKTFDLAAIIVRPTNNYGPYQFPEKVIPLFITNLFEGKKVPLYGKGDNQRDWLFVEDNCRAIELIFQKGKPGETYNVGAGNETPNLKLTQTLIQQICPGEKDRIEYVQDRLGHDFRYSVNVSKLKALGYKPSVTFEEGIRRTIEWYRKNEAWWRPLKKDKYTVK